MLTITAGLVHRPIQPHFHVQINDALPILPAEQETSEDAINLLVGMKWF